MSIFKCYEHSTMCDTCLIYCARQNGYTVKQINYIYDISTEWNENLHLHLNSVCVNLISVHT